MRILAIDPALANVGWMLLEFIPQRLDLDPSMVYPDWVNVNPNHFDPDHKVYPSWMDKEKEGGVSTYHCFRRLNGGLYSTNNSVTIQERLTEQVDQIHMLVSVHRPDLLVYEAQLEVGNRRCTWGVALQLGIIFPYFNIGLRQVRLFHLGSEDSAFMDPAHIPSLGVAIKPNQLQSIAHHERSTKPKTVVQRYKELTGMTGKVSDHEADAYFLGVHAGRFWATCVNEHWGQEILTQKEYHVFLDSNTGMLFREGESWWANQA